jgi:hypothetical protein
MGSATFGWGDAATIVVQFGAITFSASPVSRLGDVDDERRQAKRNTADFVIRMPEPRLLQARVAEA